MVESKNQFLIIPEHSGEFAEEILAELVEQGCTGILRQGIDHKA